MVPRDENVYKYDSEGLPLVEMPEDAPVKKAVAELMKYVLE